MKATQLVFAAFVVVALPCSAAISVSVQTGELLDSSSAVVSDASLWAIIYDSNGDGILPGSLEPDSSLTPGDAAQIRSDFAGKQIVTDAMIGGDRILWAGAVDGPNTSGIAGIGGQNLTNFTFASLGVVAGGKWAVYWFPDLTSGSNTLGSFSFQIGGIMQTAVGASGGTIGMVFPATDDTAISFDASFIDFGNDGDIAPSRLTALAIVPVLTPIESWRQTWYGTTSNSCNAADDADPYHTGIQNLAVFAFFGQGQDPALAQVGFLPQVQLSGGSCSYSFSQPAGVGGISYRAESSTTLLPGSWQVVPDTGTAPQHVFSVPVDSAPERFLRLKVTNP
jgi:hypothetical protein